MFTLLSRGSTTSETAAGLDISVSTVINHTSRIKEKLGAHDRREIINYAPWVGLLGSQEP